jgi:hypothetical protein
VLLDAAALVKHALPIMIGWVNTEITVLSRQRTSAILNMYYDKNTVSLWLINASIRNVFSGACPITNHLSIMSANQIVREYAKARKIALPNDLADLVLAEHRTGFESMQKSRYNFFKHANKDADTEIDVTNLQISNEIDLLLTQGNHICVFETRSRHMHVFYMYMTIRYGRVFDGAAMLLPSDLKDQVTQAIDMNRGKSRYELISDFAEVVRRDEHAKKEFDEVQSLALADQTTAAPVRVFSGNTLKRKRAIATTSS